MNLYVRNNTFWFELENLTRLFFPNEKINVFKEFNSTEKPFILASLSDKIEVTVSIGDFYRSGSVKISGDANTDELSAAQLLYGALKDFSGVSQPWGLLTGVRPVKLLRKISEEEGTKQADKKFTEDFYVSGENLRLARVTEENERKILSLSTPESFSLYVGIPFCPSRCSYCSFVMSSIERAKNLIEPYTRLLCEEINATAQIASDLGLRLESVYFGGGTPTTLSAEQLDRVLGAVNAGFDMSTCREFTVEAGRPDTITAEKLYALKENKVGRISINPQTLNPEALKAIGRRHSVENFLSAFELARSCGFDNINTDLIVGLPSDTADSFRKSLDRIISLGAESITVHTLCMKRASTLTTEGAVLNSSDAERAGEMLRYSRSRLFENAYSPYYLYRQTRMVGNHENVGWAKKGCESLYNVYVMDETHTVLACGSGGVTKLKDPGADYLKRVFNYKYPYEYIDRFGEMLKRKAEILSFYRRDTVDY